MNSDKETDNYAKRLADRFGALPEELDNLFYVVKIRNAGAAIGFEKIIVKNGLLIAFFVSNPMSPYYKSRTFASVMEKIAASPGKIELKQNENKLKILSRNISSLKEAYGILSGLK